MCQWLEQLPLYSLCSLTQPVPVALLGGYVVFWNLQNQGLSIGTESSSPWFLSWELPEGNTVLLCIAWLPCFPWEPWCKLWVFYQFKTSNMRCIPLDYGCRSLRVLCGQTLAVEGLWILNTQIFIFISINSLSTHNKNKIPKKKNEPGHWLLSPVSVWLECISIKGTPDLQWQVKMNMLVWLRPAFHLSLASHCNSRDWLSWDVKYVGPGC